MSALDGWIDVCRTGKWTDSSNREVEVTEAMLDGYVAAHPGQDPVPVVVGHPAQDAPAYGWVDGLRRTGDRLQAKFRDIAPAFREAVEAGRYAGRSVAIKGGALRHVGFLGGRAPAVPGLAPTQFSAEADTVLQFAAGDDGELAMPQPVKWAVRMIADLARGLREDIIAEKGIEEADQRIPSWRIDELNRAADEMEEAQAFSEPATETGTEKEIDVDLEKLREALNLSATATEEEILAKAAEMGTGHAAREASLKAREEAQAKTARFAAADAALKPHVDAGRVLPAERAPLAALLASLPEDETVVAFAAPEGEVQEKPRAVLERFLSGLPERVNYRELAGGKVPARTETGADNAAVAAKARTLLSEAEARGETMTAIEARDIAARELGLHEGSAG